MKTDIYPKISIVLNILLGLAVVYMFVFHKGDAIKKYEAEISRLETENVFMLKKYDELSKLNQESINRVTDIDTKINGVNKSLNTVNKELKRLEGNGKKDKEDFVNRLSNDSVAIEFTNYIQRRNKR
jgi:predicted nuclease with TOPRIM domain